MYYFFLSIKINRVFADAAICYCCASLTTDFYIYRSSNTCYHWIPFTAPFTWSTYMYQTNAALNGCTDEGASLLLIMTVKHDHFHETE